jgi:hypothetical protein
MPLSGVRSLIDQNSYENTIYAQKQMIDKIMIIRLFAIQSFESASRDKNSDTMEVYNDVCEELGYLNAAVLRSIVNYPTSPNFCQ